MNDNNRGKWFGLIAGLTFAIFSGLVIAVPIAEAASVVEATTSPADTAMGLQGGEEGTIFKSLRIEGEDRIRIEFDRPVLQLALDARTAPGLDFEIVRAALARNSHDLVTPFMARSAVTRGPLFARPWFNTFVSGSVVRFRPALEGVEQWRLDVADSRGNTVMSYEGKGKPPKELNWDGRTIDGTPAPPGLTYSYVLEAYDRAGNKRNFVGEGFELPPYVVQNGSGIALLFSGKALRASLPSADSGTMTSPILFEAATRINQSAAAGDPIRVEVTARSFEQAKNNADVIVAQLTPLVLGDPLRFQPITTVEPDAPDGGTVRIVVGSK
ncbi:MAG: hypothetical protein JSW50_10415 [Candidatus Latescibacterota bacterium]|nr:MAG: hypothetical protein JSW50_10415 [Candidatus Latescibacterota bacterium]